MPRCPNGHEQGLSLTCAVCGTRLSYKEALGGLLKLPDVHPDFGKSSGLFVGFPPPGSGLAYAGVVGVGEQKGQTLNDFILERIQGGTWFDYSSMGREELSRWLRAVAFDRSEYKFVVVDTRDPLSVLAVNSVPAAKGTLVVAVTADESSTAVEQNTSYVAVSSALKKGFPMLAFPASFVEDLFLLSENEAYVTKTAAVLEIFASLVGRADDLIDLVERDLHLGVQLHYLSALLSGSRNIYGGALNAFGAQSYQLPPEVGAEEVKTFHALISAEKGVQDEFETGFAGFRAGSFRHALGAECLFRAGEGPFFDLLAIYGVGKPLVLRASLRGYNAVATRVPRLKVGNVA